MNRKLQSEIDRVLKKVGEGTTEFDGILKKVYAASSSNQKEKYESDLKKEIKKLQRYRDQLKSWIASNDVKDKRPLIEARKLIETQMEQFKVCEKETKTKAYSKEGLLASNPKEDSKNEVRAWISKSLDELNRQIEQTETEVESIKAKKGKRDQDRIDHLEARLEKHRFHVNSIEKILRMVDNETLGLEKVEEIKDGVEYYIENNTDADFIDDDSLYESIGVTLDTPEDVDPNLTVDDDDDGAAAGEDGDENGTANGAADTGDAAGSDASDSAGDEPPKPAPAPEPARRAAAPAAPPAPAPAAVAPAAVAPTPVVAAPAPTPAAKGTGRQPATVAPTSQPATLASLSSAASTRPATTPAVTPAQPFAQAAAAAVAATPAEPKGARAKGNRAPVATAPPPTTAALTPVTTPPTAAAVVAQPSTAVAATSTALPRGVLARPATIAAATIAAPAAAAVLPTASSGSASVRSAAAVAAPATPTKAAEPAMMLPPPSPVALTASGAPAGSLPIPGGAGPMPNMTMPQQIPQVSTQLPAISGTAASPPTSLTSSPRDDSALSLADEALQAAGIAGGDGSSAELAMVSQAAEEQHSRNLAMLDGSMRFLPDQPTPPPGPGASPSPVSGAVPNSVIKPYVPRNPYTTPAYWPQNPPPMFDSPGFFEKLDTDTLFFIFYYQQGSYQQYLAARELKKQSWRFHKKYLTWFQRHEEPKTITNEYEQGTYVYFDYETGWCQRKKTEFTFEYRYLEDDAL